MVGVRMTVVVSSGFLGTHTHTLCDVQVVASVGWSAGVSVTVAAKSVMIYCH